MDVRVIARDERTAPLTSKGGPQQRYNVEMSVPQEPEDRGGRTGEVMTW